MRFIIIGTRQDTQQRVRVKVSAESGKEAREQAEARGIAIESCEASGEETIHLGQIAPDPPPARRSASTRQPDGPLFTEHFIAAMLNGMRGLLSETLFHTVARQLTFIGDWGALAAAILGAAVFAIVAIRDNALHEGLMAVGWLGLMPILQFVGSRFIRAGNTVANNARGRIAHTTVFECLGLLLLVGAMIVLIQSIYVSVSFRNIDPALRGVGLCLGMLLLSCLALNPRQAMKIEVVKHARPGEEAIGILTFVLKLLLKAVPIVYSGLILFAIVMFIMAIIGHINGSPMVQRAEEGYITALIGTLAPAVLYLGFLVGYLSLDVTRALLSLSGNRNEPNRK